MQQQLRHDLRLRAAASVIYDAAYPRPDWSTCSQRFRETDDQSDFCPLACPCATHCGFRRYQPRPALEKSAFVSMADVMPTLCEVMGAEIPPGVQGRSLLPLLRGEPFLGEEFRSIVTQVGVGGLYYDAKDDVPISVSRGSGGHWDELNGITQSGNEHMVRMGDWKLIYDMMGYGQLYDLAHDPHELNNLFGKQQHAGDQARLMAELAMWIIRNQDSLPTGPQNVKYRTKWARPHNWYAPYRQVDAPGPYIA